MKSWRRVVLATWLIYPAASSAEADPIRIDQAASGVVDQEYLPLPNRGATLYGNHLFAQTITAGLDGTLAGVDLYLQLQFGAGSDVNPITLHVMSTQNGEPVTSLATTTIAPASVPIDPGGLVRVDLESFGIPMTRGDQFAIALQTVFNRPNEAGFVWWGAEPGGYAGGGFLVRLSGDPDWQRLYATSDFGFRTLVTPETPPVPEPATLTLLGIGVAVLVRRARRT